MNDLLSALRLNSFERVLAAYHRAGMPLRDMIDGGAGSGSTAKQMLKYATGTVYAFEPFPGNHRFFNGIDARIRLVPKALADENRAMSFRVSSTVSEDSEWGRRGLTGYSSVGYLTAAPAENDISVECIRADRIISEGVDFVKLDLQGGEMAALKGMTGFLDTVPLMWVEYSGQPGLADFLSDHGFLLFDTEYFFMGNPTPGALTVFEASKKGQTLSTGKTAWFGFKRSPWRDFSAEFPLLRKSLGMVQTDLVCINRNALPAFTSALQFI